MAKRCSATATMLFLLSGCASMPSDHMHTWMNYTCSNGQAVQAAYPDANTALIRLKGHAYTLHIAISGSGARYVGEGWQWWTKGMRDGMLAPLAPGESIASAPGATCHAN